MSRDGLWYQIETPAGTGWVRAVRMRTKFSLPVVHFAAGLYRYQLGRYSDAAREFEQFTRMEGVKEDPASLSTGYQLPGARSAALPDVEKALQYDPSNRDARITLDRLRGLSVTGKPAAKGALPPRLFQEDLMRSGPALRNEIETLSGRSRVTASSEAIRALLVERFIPGRLVMRHAVHVVPEL
jgi:hypothetical protein